MCYSQDHHHGHHGHHDSDGEMTEDGRSLPHIGNSLGKNNTGRRGTLPPPPSYYDGPAYSTKGSKPGGSSNIPPKRQTGAASIKYGNKVVQGSNVSSRAATGSSLTSQTSIKYNKAKGATSSAVGTGVGKQGAGGGKYLSPSSLRNLAVQEQA